MWMGYEIDKCISNLKKWRCFNYIVKDKDGQGRKRVRCSKSKSYKFGTWFGRSNITIEEILLLTYEILIWQRTDDIMQQYNFSSSTMCDWRNFVNERIVEYMESKCNTEKICGEGCIVQVDESKFGKRKYHKGRKVDGQWVFGDIERGTGRMFLVPVEDRKKPTLHRYICQYIEKGSTIYSDCWKCYYGLKRTSCGERQPPSDINIQFFCIYFKLILKKQGCIFLPLINVITAFLLKI